MILPDVNVLVYAHRGDAPDHARYADWLEDMAGGDEAFGIADLVLSGFLRIVTHPRIFLPPTPLEDALAFATALRERPTAFRLSPDPATGICSSRCVTALAPRAT